MLIYRSLTTTLSPGMRLLLRLRASRGQEDGCRLGERFGVSAAPRPDGPLLWTHAVSVGEAVSALPLLERLRERHGLHVLFTTTTVAAARLIQQHLPPGGIHQFLPLDHWPWVQRFLNHWQPDYVLWVESDFWPGVMAQIHQRGIPAALVNGRVSERSLRRWLRFPSLVGKALGGFRPCLAASEEQARRLAALGADNPRYVGNLKAAPGPLLETGEGQKALREALGQRPCWVAASTHPGEETAVINAHRQIAVRTPRLLTALAPRHLARADSIAAEAGRAGLPIARRSRGELPGPEHDLYLVDTLGELPLFYELMPVCFIGGSLANHAGHNPFEAMHMGCAVVHGPHVDSFHDVYAQLEAHKAAQRVEDEAALAQTIEALLHAPEETARMAARARKLPGMRGDVVEAIYRELASMFKL